MPIIASVKYVITARYFDGGPDKGPEQYVDTFNKLKGVIATTWSKIPHQVNVKDNVVEVAQGVKRLATFEFSALPTLELPDHL